MRWRPSAGLVLVLVLAFATPAGEFFQSVVSPSVFIPRNLISSSPGLALLIGVLVSAPRQPIRVIAVASLLAGFAIGAVKMLDADNRRPDYDGVADFIERTGGPTAPVVDTGGTAGLQTPMEAALAPPDEPRPSGRAVLVIGLPTFRTRYEAARRLQVPAFVPQGSPPDQLAHQARADAGDGKLFLIGSDSSLAQLRRAATFFGGPVGEFLAALPPGYHEVEYRSFPGFYNFRIGVHVLEWRPGARSASAKR